MLRFDEQQNVDLLSGAAQASVPLGEITSGALRLALSLAYSYSGLRVAAPHDLVGLGWALQAGGSVSRQVVGTLDATPGGPFGPAYNSDTLVRHLSDQLMLKNAMGGRVDVAPDLYSFTVAGYTGRFLLQDTTPVLLPPQPVQIRMLNRGQAFQLGTDPGVRYLFEAQEITYPNHNNFGNLGSHTSAWLLTRIISANNQDTIRLHYSLWNYQEQSRIAHTSGQYYLYGFGINTLGTECSSSYTYHNTTAYGSHIRAQVLDSITTRGSRILIDRDAQHIIQSVRLLAVTPHTRKAIRTFTLSHSYFPGRSGSLDQRLRLDRVQESNGALRLPAYALQYNDALPLPARTSTAQDHWGYYNGAHLNGENSTAALLPDPRLGAAAANRSPNAEFAQAGALLRITYPTGGYTAFSYEGGSYATADEYQTRYRSLIRTATDTSPFPFAPRLPPSVRSLATLHGDSTVFTLTEQSQVIFRTRRSPNGKHESQNQREDVLILHQLPGRDTVVLKGKAPIDSVDGRWIRILPAGTYTAWALCDDWEYENELTFSIPYQVFAHDAPGPGVRVRQTTTVSPGSAPLIKTYDYQVPDSRGAYSSGKMLLPTRPNGAPIYNSHQYEVRSDDTDCTYEITSSDNTEFGSEYSKYTFFYERVAERRVAGSANLGAVISYFQQQPELFNDVVLTSRVTYRQLPGGQPQVAQRERHHFRRDATTASAFYAIRPWQSYAVNLSGTRNYQGPIERFETDKFDLRTAFIAPDTVRLTRYDERGDSSQSVTVSGYRRQRLARYLTQTSTGWQISRYKYLGDYNPRDPAVAALRVGNPGFNPLIESQTWQQLAQQPDSGLVAGRLTLFDPTWHSPASSWSLRLEQPKPRPDQEQLVNGYYTAFQSDTQYQLDESVQYSPTGLLVQRQFPYGLSTAYIWGYNRSYPVAQVENATYQAAAHVLGTASLNRLLSAEPGTDAQVRQLLQPLRLQLPQARVSTYTYEPLIGATSLTDPAGRTSFFEYDLLGRLVRARDEQQRLLSQQEYHYARP